MKKSLFSVFLSLYCTAAGLRAQGAILNLQDFTERTFHWGFYLGVDRFDFSQSPKPEGIDKNAIYKLKPRIYPGLTVGLMGDWRLHKNIDLRLEPAIHYTKRDLVFRREAAADWIYKLKSNYLDIPLLLKFSSDRWGNIRPYVSAGLGLIYDLNADEDSDQDVYPTRFPLRKMNYSYQLEWGVELYFTDFKLIPAVKGIFMLNDEMVPDRTLYRDAIASQLHYLKGRAIVFSLKFE